MGWTVETLNKTVDRELAGLPPGRRARFVRIVELIEAVGLPNVRKPHVKHVSAVFLRDSIGEIWLKGKAGPHPVHPAPRRSGPLESRPRIREKPWREIFIAPALYVMAPGKRVVVVRAFLNRTAKTPDREIDIALERAKELEDMTKVKDLHRGWMKDPKYKAEYETLEDEFQLVRTLIEARVSAGLTQTQLAQRMKTSQSYVARFESGELKPTTLQLKRLAKATGTRLKITFEPADAD